MIEDKDEAGGRDGKLSVCEELKKVNIRNFEMERCGEFNHN